MTVVTLGVGDLRKSIAFYTAVFGIRPHSDNEGIAFFELPGTWLTLYPRDKLAEDISPTLSSAPGGFSGVTLAYNARGKDEVLAVFKHVKVAGAGIAKPPQDAFWGV